MIQVKIFIHGKEYTMAPKDSPEAKTATAQSQADFFYDWFIKAKFDGAKSLQFETTTGQFVVLGPGALNDAIIEIFDTPETA